MYCRHENPKEGDSIRCRYHGLKPGPDGVAQEMPLKADRVNKGVCVESFAVAERHRFVWIWVGDKAKADEALIPNLWPVLPRAGPSTAATTQSNAITGW